MDLAATSHHPPSPDISHISETNMDLSLKELKKEKFSESDLSNLSAIVIDDLSDDIIIPETQNDIQQKHTKGAKKDPIVIPETPKNKSKKEPPSPTVKIHEKVKQEHQEDDIEQSNSGINAQLPVYSDLYKI